MKRPTLPHWHNQLEPVSVKPSETPLAAPPLSRSGESGESCPETVCPCCGANVTDQATMDRIGAHKMDIASLKSKLDQAVNAWDWLANRRKP